LVLAVDPDHRCANRHHGGAVLLVIGGMPLAQLRAPVHVFRRQHTGFHPSIYKEKPYGNGDSSLDFLHVDSHEGALGSDAQPDLGSSDIPRSAAAGIRYSLIERR
jgi:hypothetical protein